jgi:hypothetical protein
LEKLSYENSDRPDFPVLLMMPIEITWGSIA